MAIAFVQGPAAVSGSSVTTVSATFASDTTNGNHISVGCMAWGGGGGRTISSVTDNKSNTYTLQAEDLQSNVRARTAFSSGITGGASHEVTLTISSSGNATIAINEFSGVGAADVTSSNGAESTSATPGAVSPTGTCLYFATVSYDESSTTITPPGGSWTQRQEIETQFININTITAVTTGSQNPTWTIGGGGKPWAAAIATFNEAAAGAATGVGWAGAGVW